MGHTRSSLFRFIGLLTLGLLVSLSGAGARPSIAQSGSVSWSEPINLSNTPQDSTHPAIVADSLGYVHVFWTEDIGGEPVQAGRSLDTGNSIMYTFWDGKVWSPSIDIFSLPDEGVADFVAAAVDRHNTLHVVWLGQSNIYYSSAPAWQAGSARAWLPPQVVGTNGARSRWSTDIATDAAGTVHVIYATGGLDAGVYYIQSRDNGTTWEAPVNLAAPLDSSEISFSNARLITDRAGRPHAVWETNDLQGYGKAIYYARSTDGGANWDRAAQLAYRTAAETWVEYPYLTARSESEIHLIYINATNRGRAHRISLDGGETWSEPRSILNDMEGINGYVIPLVDGLGQMHLVINMRTRATQTGGLYYARWLGTDWSPVVPIETTALASAHWTAAAISRGNEIHVVCDTLRTGETWYFRGAVPEVPRATVQSVPTPEPALSPMPTTAADIAAPAVVRPDRPVTTKSAPNVPDASPLIPATGAALLLIVGMAAVWMRRHQR
ncbi:hypothetical protein ANRL3_00487 [Anaerolineae bacterium]|nr:hypothetical protein ANRL3_00487 [Anaerolineae bacterium]